jgi:hypothetical protein
MNSGRRFDTPTIKLLALRMLIFLLFEQRRAWWRHYYEKACMEYAKHAEPVEAAGFANAAHFNMFNLLFSCSMSGSAHGGITRNDTYYDCL